MKKSASLAVLVFGSMLALSPTSVIGHDEVNNPGKPKHGGQFVMLESHYGIEMVAGADQLVFYLTEHSEPMDLTGSSFKAVVQTDAGTKMLRLTPDGNRLTTKLDAELPDGTKIALSGKDADGHTLQARFVKK